MNWYILKPTNYFNNNYRRKMKYYLITEKCRDGDHEYYDSIPVSTATPRDKWEANWENLFLCGQYSCDALDSYGLWSDNRIVSIYEVREITLDEYDTMGRMTYGGSHTLEDFLESGRESWEENEFQEQMERIKE